jgi:secondary thiamine-phosphate synthase enzyme
MKSLAITTKAKREVVDITEAVAAAVVPGSGAVHVTVLHTTAALTTADLDPGTDQDFLDFLEGITPNPPEGAWRHPHNPAHTPDHLLASLIGPSVSVPVTDGKLVLGTWQRIVLVELDGPRTRDVAITFSPDSVPPKR